MHQNELSPLTDQCGRVISTFQTIQNLAEILSSLIHMHVMLLTRLTPRCDRNLSSTRKIDTIVLTYEKGIQNE